MAHSAKYEVDPADPRAPSVEVWEALSDAERSRIVEQLPSEIELMPPEGDPHRIPKQRGMEALDAFFRRTGRRIYLSSELPVYYPAEPMFAPDLIAVCDVEPHERMRWVVTQEGRGLDFALEVTLSGSRKKDLEENVVRCARLGIPEYFVFDRAARRLFGWRLVELGRPYEPIVPQGGRWRSNVLGLDLAVEGDRFRFYLGTAVVPEAAELIARANSLVDELQDKLEHLDAQIVIEQQRAEKEQQRAEKEQQRAEKEQQRAEKEQQRAEKEQQRAERAEAELEKLRAELEQLRRERQ